MDAADRVITWILLVAILIVELTILVRIDRSLPYHPTLEAPRP